MNYITNFLGFGPTHALGNGVSSFNGVKILGLKKSLESVDDLSKVLVLKETYDKYQCYNQSELNSQYIDPIPLGQFIVTHLTNATDLKQFKIADLLKIRSIATKSLSGEWTENAQHLLNLIEQQFIAELNQWETEGDKEEAIRRITEAYKNKSETLYLDNLGLTSLPPVIGLLTHLKILDVSSNKLGSLPGWIGLLTGLVEFFLGYNLLPSLPSEIGNLTALTFLNVGKNHLSSLPNSIGNLTALTKLDVRSNQLLSLPDSIGNLTALTKLDVSENLLCSLPNSIGNLTALTWLNINNNQLSSLPDSIGNLTALTWLWVYNNQLSSLPNSIGNLTGLIELLVDHNQLSSLPDSIGNLTALTKLSVYKNQLHSLPDSIGNLTALISLSSSENQLRSLPDSIGNLTALVELIVNKNQLRSLPDSIGNLTALTRLLVSKNELSSLPDSIGNLTALTALDYSLNYLEQDPEIDLPNLTTHSAWGNPFNTVAMREANGGDQSVNGLLNAIKKAAKEDPSSGLNLTQLSLDPNGSLHLWLERCIQSEEWKTRTTKQNFATGILEIVRYADTDESYRETFNSVLADQTCSDRATLAYDTLKLNMEMAKLGPNAEEGQVVAIFKRDFIAYKLTQIAYDMTEELESRARANERTFDQISAVLAYRQNVGKMLSATIGSETMTFVNMAFLEESDYIKAKEMVEEDLKKIEPVALRFLQNTAWITYIDKRYASAKERALSTQAKKMVALDKKSKRMTDGAYQKEARKLNEEYNTLESKWRLYKTKEILGNIPQRGDEF